MKINNKYNKIIYKTHFEIENEKIYLYSHNNINNKSNDIFKIIKIKDKYIKFYEFLNIKKYKEISIYNNKNILYLKEYI